MATEMSVKDGKVPCPVKGAVPVEECKKCDKKPTYGSATVPVTSREGKTEYDTVPTVSCPHVVDASERERYDRMCKDFYAEKGGPRPRIAAEKAADEDIERRNMKGKHPHQANPDSPDN